MTPLARHLLHPMPREPLRRRQCRALPFLDFLQNIQPQPMGMNLDDMDEDPWIMSLPQGDEWNPFASQADNSSMSPIGEGPTNLASATAIQESTIAQDSPPEEDTATRECEEMFEPQETEVKQEARIAKEICSTMNTALWIQVAILGVVASIAVHHWLKK